MGLRMLLVMTADRLPLTPPSPARGEGEENRRTVHPPSPARGEGEEAQLRCQITGHPCPAYSAAFAGSTKWRCQTGPVRGRLAVFAITARSFGQFS